MENQKNSVIEEVETAAGEMFAAVEQQAGRSLTSKEKHILLELAKVTATEEEFKLGVKLALLMYGNIKDAGL